VSELLAVLGVALVGVVGDKLALVLPVVIIGWGEYIVWISRLTKGTAPKWAWHHWWC
jgi:hypothetical protein